jgi:hypothetical protein
MWNYARIMQNRSESQVYILNSDESHRMCYMAVLECHLTFEAQFKCVLM